MAAEFVVDEAVGPSCVEVLTGALQVRVDVHHTERRVWFDTHDWRLFRAGLLLEHHVRKRESWLVLSDLEGQRISRQPTGRTAVTAHSLRDGVTRDRVLELIGVRALLPRVVASGPVQMLSVLGPEEKTVARIVVEGPTEVRDGAAVGLRARIESLRGYDKDAAKVCRTLDAIPGFGSAKEPLFESVFRAAGLHPRSFRSKPDLEFTRRVPATQAFAGTLTQLREIVLDNVEGTLRQLDTEFLHDLRVTVRRTRAVLKFAHGTIDEDIRARYAVELKWLADQTSLSRDLDVYLLGFDDLVSHVSASSELEPFREQVTRHCTRAHAALNRALRSERFAALLDGWHRELAVPGPIERPVIEVADELLSRAWKRVAKRGDAITETSPAEAVHDLRKRCKELRYLLEFFGSLYGADARSEAVSELKLLQDILGEFQDAEAQRMSVHQYAVELAKAGTPPATLMAMGRLEHHLQLRQDAARAEVADRWHRFNRKHNQRLYARMVTSR
ncbi:CHAD domain-containing protein [Kribbella sp. NPDC026596]|uniref:CHAD domain-containing protein n=1 Tax=Kribbella sp. NPDC026596 TaxID=3155122 RepID=UPI0033C154C4